MTTSRYEKSLQLIRILSEEGYETRLVGGCVRDRLLGLTPKDYDLATTAKPDVMRDIMRKKGFATIDVGIEHGTVMVVHDQDSFEITTLRYDVQTDGRRAEVAFTDSFEADAARRDFTFNAMSEDSHGKIYDYFHGQEDLAEKTIRFVGDPKARILEDHLRILRYFRFASRLQCHMDASTLATMKEHAPLLEKLSRERIKQEWEKLFECPKMASYLKIMGECQIVSHSFPGIRDGMAPKTLEICDGLEGHLPLTRWHLIFSRQSVKRMTSDIFMDWKFSKKESKELLALDTPLPRQSVLDNATCFQWINQLEHKSIPQFFEQVFYPYWKLCLTKEKSPLLTQLEKIQEKEITFGHLRKNPLPLNGHDISQILTLSEGHRIGEIYEQLQKGYWNGVWHSKDEGVGFLKRRF